MTFVVDSSVAPSWCLEDERTAQTTALLERVGKYGAHMPRHWPQEMLNRLMMAERRKRIDAACRRRLAEFPRELVGGDVCRSQRSTGNRGAASGSAGVTLLGADPA